MKFLPPSGGHLSTAAGLGYCTPAQIQIAFSCLPAGFPTPTGYDKGSRGTIGVDAVAHSTVTFPPQFARELGAPTQVRFERDDLKGSSLTHLANEAAKIRDTKGVHVNCDVSADAIRFLHLRHDLLVELDRLEMAMQKGRSVEASTRPVALPEKDLAGGPTEIKPFVGARELEIMPTAASR